MKLFITFIAFVSMTAFAAEPMCTSDSSELRITKQLEIKTDVPSHLKGATIIVRLADGRESSVPAEMFKVVPRKQQFVTTEVEKLEVATCTVTDRSPRKNRVSLLGGHGAQTGITSTQNGAIAEVESNVGLVGGAQYQRMLTERWSIGVQGQTNKTGSVMIGLDF